MINTSTQFKNAIDDKNRHLSCRDKYVFGNGTTLELDLDDFLSYAINDATSESGKFQIGAAVIKKYTATLNNSEGKFSKFDFEGTDIYARVALDLPDGTTEILQKGKFRVVDANSSSETINVVAYDSMLFFDRPYSESNLSYPATIQQIVVDACVHCQMTFDASSLTMPSYKVSQRPDDDTLTFRDMISYCAQIMCCYAKINTLDALTFGWYRFDSIPTILDGGHFDDDTPYSSGDNADGGTFSPWNTGDVYDAGTFQDMNNYHHLFVLGSPQSINTDDIEFTGVKITVDKQACQIGEDGYLIGIEDNPLIQSITDAQTVGEHIGSKMIGIRIRPLKITCRSDPSIEAGDCTIVTDRKQNSYGTVITETTFSLGGMQNVEASAETPTEKNYVKYGAATKILHQSSKDVQEQLSMYDIAVQQLNQLAANTMGFYATVITLEDGSTISYRHDKPILAESKVVYKSGISGFFVTENYQGTDEATEWKAGFDSNGNAVLNVLSAIGINFDWARGGTLTLGGYGNGNGVIKMLGSNDVENGSWNNTGLITTNGEYTVKLGSGKLQVYHDGLLAGVLVATHTSYNDYRGLGLITDGKIIAIGKYSDNGGYTSSYRILYHDSGEIHSIACDGNAVAQYSDSGIYFNRKLYVMGNEIVGTSDERLKTNIEEYSGSALNIINGIDLYTFEWVENGKPDVGFIAQQVQEVIPETVYRDDKTDSLGICESKMMRYLWKAVQELSAEVDELKGRKKKKKKKFRKSRMSLKNKKKFADNYMEKAGEINGDTN